MLLKCGAFFKKEIPFGVNRKQSSSAVCTPGLTAEEEEAKADRSGREAVLSYSRAGTVDHSRTVETGTIEQEEKQEIGADSNREFRCIYTVTC